MLDTSEAFCGFAVQDLDAAQTFYGQTLGLNVTPAAEMRGLLRLQIHGSRDILIYIKPDHVPATYTILNFPVSDIDGIVRELTERGVEFIRYPGFQQDELGIATNGGPRIAWFTDPSGNILSVLQA